MHARRNEQPKSAAASLFRLRRVTAWLVLASPAIAIVATDVARRGDQLWHYSPAGLVHYAWTMALSALVWSGLLVAASAQRGAGRWVARVVLAVGATFAVGSQAYTFDHYHGYLNTRAVLVGTRMLSSVGGQLWSDRATYARSLLPPIAVSLLLPLLYGRLARTRPRAGRCSVDLTVVAAFIAAFFTSPVDGDQGETPDILYVAAMGQLSRARWDHNETVERTHPGRRTPRPLPALDAQPSRKRNVLLVLTESIRAQSVCVAYDPKCVFSPFSNEAVPNRIPLVQMRAIDSTTAISLAVMWTGLLPTESRQELHSAPLLWEYARAAGFETAYWTSQNLLFGNSGAWLEGLPLTRQVSATELEPDADLDTGADDGRLADHVIRDIGQLPEPFVAVVHLSNTHYPYKVDHNYAPWLPESEATGPGYEAEIKNRYQDAIYLQDRALGRLLRSIRSRPESARTIIVYLSDHGEQMREKGAVGHTGTLFEQEIRIPAWIDAPKGTLSDDEERALRSLSEQPLTIIDVFPTLLDLMGLWDATAIAPFKAKMTGQSLLRGGTPPDRPIVMTNCTELWDCAFRNWGAIRGTLKLIAHQGDNAWNCYDVANDPDEVRNLGADACGELRGLAEGGRGRPFSTRME